MALESVCWRNEKCWTLIPDPLRPKESCLFSAQTVDRIKPSSSTSWKLRLFYDELQISCHLDWLSADSAFASPSPLDAKKLVATQVQRVPLPVLSWVRIFEVLLTRAQMLASEFASSSCATKMAADWMRKPLRRMRSAGSSWKGGII